MTTEYYFLITKNKNYTPVNVIEFDRDNRFKTRTTQDSVIKIVGEASIPKQSSILNNITVELKKYIVLIMSCIMVFISILILIIKNKSNIREKSNRKWL
jgi:hypothetical protein